MCRSNRNVKMPCGVRFMGGIIQFMNVLFLLVGGAVVGVGIYVMVELQSDNLDLLGGIYLPIGIIVLGVVVMLVSIVGCCGARRRSKFCLSLYVTVLLVVLMVQLGLIIALYVYRDNVPDDFEKAWKDLKASDQTKLMKSFDCCGWKQKNGTVPDMKPGAQCPAKATKTCAKQIDDFVNDNLLTIVIAALVLFVIELLGFVFGLWMCCGIRVAIDEVETEALISDARRHRHERRQHEPRVYENKYADSERFPSIHTERVEEHHHHHHGGSNNTASSDWTF